MTYDSTTSRFYYLSTYPKVGIYSFTVLARDSSDNWYSIPSNFLMVDITLPSINSVTTSPDPQEVHGDVNMTVDVVDNYQLEEVAVIITDPDGQVVGNFSMTFDPGSGSYYYDSSYSVLGDYTFTVWAKDSSGNCNYSSGSFTMQDTTPPTLSDVLAAPSPQEVHGNVNITVSVSDNYQLGEIKVEVIDPDGQVVGNFSMAFDTISGKYYYEDAYSMPGNHSINVWAVDLSGNWNILSTNFMMVDTAQPVVSSVVSTPNPQEVFGNVNITALVTDNYRLEEVSVLITDPDGVFLGNLSMSFDPGSNLYYHDSAYFMVGTYIIIVFAIDPSGNWISEFSSFDMVDGTPPEISGAAVDPDPQEVYLDVNITAVVQDNYELIEVRIVILDPDAVVVGNFSMMFDAGVNRYYRVTSTQKIGTYTFTIWVRDSSDNWNSSSGSFFVEDSTSPIVSSVAETPDPQEVNNRVNITTVVSDNYMLSGVQVEITDPDGQIVGNFSMVFHSMTGQYFYESPYFKIGTYTLTVSAQDTSGNWNAVSSAFAIQDKTPPTVSNVNVIPDPQVVYGWVDISAQVLDNYMLTDVFIEVTDPAASSIGNFSMTYDVASGRYLFGLDCDLVGIYDFTIAAVDSSGNWEVHHGQFMIEDDTPPVISNTTTIPSQQFPSGKVNVSASVFDNYMLSEVRIHITDPNLVTMGNTTMGHDLSGDRYFWNDSYGLLGVYRFCIWGGDSSGNWASHCGQFAIADGIVPIISNVAADPDPQEIYGVVNITAVVTDNYLVEEVKLLILDPTGAPIGNFSMLFDGNSGVFYHETSYSILGTYSFDIWAKDGGGNWASAFSSFAIQASIPPDANAGADQEITHGDTITFDGSGSSDNHAIDSYEWTFNYGSGVVVLYGVAPEHTFTEPGTYMVTLKVTDVSGNDDQDTMNVNVIGEKIPNAPENLAISDVGENFVLLNWTAPTTNTDGSELTNLKGYKVYRSNLGGGPYTLIATLIVLSESYRDRGLEVGSEGFYVVTAFNFDGAESEYSNEAFAKIPEKGSISGTIVDEVGEPVVGATIELTKNGERVVAVQSNARGNFTILDIEDGVYELVVTKTGYATLGRHVMMMGGAQIVVYDLTIERLPDTGSGELPFTLIILLIVILVVVAAIIVAIVLKRRSKKKRDE
jgi:PKD repeat protein